MFLTPGHDRSVDEVENNKGDEEEGQCPAEVAPEVAVFEVKCHGNTWSTYLSEYHLYFFCHQ